MCPRNKSVLARKFRLTFAPRVVNLSTAGGRPAGCFPQRASSTFPFAKRLSGHARNLFDAGKTLHSNRAGAGTTTAGLEIVCGTGGLGDSASLPTTSRCRAVRAFADVSLKIPDRERKLLHRSARRVHQSDADRPGVNLWETNGKVSLCSASLPSVNRHV
jgi:hypothetical protein